MGARSRSQVSGNETFSWVPCVRSVSHTPDVQLFFRVLGVGLFFFIRVYIRVPFVGLGV